MNLSHLVQNLIKIIGFNADFPVYEFFPDNPVCNEMYSIIGISSLKINNNAGTDKSTGLPITVQLKISLFAPPETNKLMLIEKYENSIINVLLNSNLRIAGISGFKTEFNKGVQLVETYSFISISGMISQSGGENS